MARKKSPTLTELELRLMHIIWRQEEVTVEDISQALEETRRPLAQPSIRTMLRILHEKGYITRERAGRGFVYRAEVQETEAKKHILKDMIGRVFDGSASNLVAALVQQGMVDQADLEQARKLIQERERGNEK